MSSEAIEIKKIENDLPAIWRGNEVMDLPKLTEVPAIMLKMEYKVVMMLARVSGMKSRMFSQSKAYFVGVKAIALKMLSGVPVPNDGSRGGGNNKSRNGDKEVSLRNYRNLPTVDNIIKEVEKQMVGGGNVTISKLREFEKNRIETMEPREESEDRIERGVDYVETAFIDFLPLLEKADFIVVDFMKQFVLYDAGLVSGSTEPSYYNQFITKSIEWAKDNLKSHGSLMVTCPPQYLSLILNEESYSELKFKFMLGVGLGKEITSADKSNVFASNSWVPLLMYQFGDIAYVSMDDFRMCESEDMWIDNVIKYYLSGFVRQHPLGVHTVISGFGREEAVRLAPKFSNLTIIEHIFSREAK